MEQPSTTTHHSGAFAPLMRNTFRWIWFATVVSSIGDWMENVGSGWLMTELSSSATLVSLVQTASSLPFVLVALPAGALADIVDRRRILIVTQWASVGVLVPLAVLTAISLITPLLLLILTLILSLLYAIATPSWQAIVPDLVPKEELRSAIALNSSAINVARAVGPGIAGLLMVWLGVALVYVADALCFVFVVLVLLKWKRKKRQHTRAVESDRVIEDRVRSFDVGDGPKVRHLIARPTEG